MHFQQICKKQKSQRLKLSESLILHPYHTAIVGGDSLVLERTDFSARIAYVDYNGIQVYQNYLNDKPRSNSEKTEFVKKLAPKIIAGIKMIDKFFDNLRKNNLQSLQIQKNSMLTTS